MAFRGQPVVGAPAFATPTGAVHIGDAAVQGAGPAAASSQHVHQFPAPAAGYVAMLAAVGVDGSSGAPSRADHQHPHPASDHAPGGPFDISATFLTRHLAVGDNLIWNQRLGDGTLLNPVENSTTQHGIQNIAVGNNALANDTDGSWNIGIGPDALWQNTTGNENVAVGIQALLACTTGFDNTAIGTGAMNGGNLGTGSPLPPVTGNYNTAVGVTSGAQVTTGSDNVFAGNNSGMSPGQAFPTKAGSFNTLLGRYTGASVGDPSYTTAVGANVTVDGDGSVAIGCDHLGQGAGATGQDDFCLGSTLHHVRIPSGFLSGGAGNGAMVVAGGGATAIIALRPQGTASDAGAMHLLSNGGMQMFDGGGVARSTVYSGTGAPTLSATAGDIYYRTDTPTVANQRIYVCTGGTAWTGIA